MRIDSAFFFQIRPGDKKFVRNWTRIRSHFSSCWTVAGVCVVVSFEKTRLNCQLDRLQRESEQESDSQIWKIPDPDPDPVSSEISDLLLFVSYFASQNKGIKLGDITRFLCVLCKLNLFG